jgi:ubiquinone/menaquinone biosynthesis C-methylase UbiE
MAHRTSARLVDTGRAAGHDSAANTASHGPGHLDDMGASSLSQKRAYRARWCGRISYLILRPLFMRFYAARYDTLIGPAEQAGLARERHNLIGKASGATIEVGAGTGLNLEHYPPAVTKLVLVEPDPHMRRRLKRRVAKIRRNTEVLNATAEHLPFSDGSFDTIVVTFTLCSVSDERAALDEITRILAPGGQLLFLEHVRSMHPRIAARQDELPFSYRLIGCNPNRDTLQEIESSMLKVESLIRGEVPMAPEIERPMISGTARRPQFPREGRASYCGTDTADPIHPTYLNFESACTDS